jgi:hypothetical protein
VFFHRFPQPGAGIQMVWSLRAMLLAGRRVNVPTVRFAGPPVSLRTEDACNTACMRAHWPALALGEQHRITGLWFLVIRSWQEARLSSGCLLASITAGGRVLRRLRPLAAGSLPQQTSCMHTIMHACVPAYAECVGKQHNRLARRRSEPRGGPRWLLGAQGVLVGCRQRRSARELRCLLPALLP